MHIINIYTDFRWLASDCSRSQVQNNYNPCNWFWPWSQTAVEHFWTVWLCFRLNRSMIHPASIQTISFGMNIKLQGFWDFTTRFQALHTNKSTLSQTSKSTALPFQHYSCSFHIEFDFNAVILQESCSGHSCTSRRTSDKYCKSSFAEELDRKHRHPEVRCNLDKWETGTSPPLNERETNNRKNTALPTFESISKQRVVPCWLQQASYQ